MGRPEAVVIGAGPAGLMAAEAMAGAGLSVTVAEAKPSPARKFLMAGKSGLNITRDEPMAAFAAAYHPPGWLTPILDSFGPDAVAAWCRGLGQPVFTGSSGRVFPVAMKASPLLRAWLARLDGLGVVLHRRWRWTGFDGTAARFDTPAGPARLAPRVTVLALGGASWARLGSDGAWAPLLAGLGVPLAPFRPANMGFRIDWSPHMAALAGQPVKGAALVVSGGMRHRGEFVISSRGIEGGAVYAASRALRDGARLAVDLMADLPEAGVAARLARAKPGDSLANRLRKAGLGPVAAALLREWGGPLPADPAALAARIKALPVPLGPPRPMDEAISTAGGIMAQGLGAGLDLHALPGVFAAGEMLDWEAPTGGYLLTASLATGRHAGLAAARRALSAG
ncbi:MAG: TIGR03862 family flavoprotein [Paracoccaceae bacterium]|nr:MAG: TIGR03862 family flavoprotein [Paracoccaceae bacterium]